jgi:hypothetical protein
MAMPVRLADGALVMGGAMKNGQPPAENGTPGWPFTIYDRRAWKGSLPNFGERFPTENQ